MANEKRLIDAGALVAHFRRTKVDEVFPNWEDLNPSVTSAIIRLTKKYREIVLNAPTVDAVEVVRCKDCKHWQHIHEHIPHMECQIFCGAHERGYPTNADDFCSYGERKDHETLQQLP